MKLSVKLFIKDGLRHTNLSGYGALSRNIILELDRLGHDVSLQRRTREWQKIESGSAERLDSLARDRHPSKSDLVLQIGTPASCQSFRRPSLIYTQNALGDLRREWVEALRRADGCIVPSSFDKRVFDRYFDRVYIAHQSSDPRVFTPRPAQRKLGSDRFTFLFVGSYGFRKGIDLLLEAFLREFNSSEGVELALRCPGAGTGNEFNHLLGYIQRINPQAHVTLFGAALPPEAMCRMYNRADCVITLSRGEGWCMPVTEALLCEVPVIAPDSTAMSDYLDEDIAFLVRVTERRISDIPEEGIATGFVRFYGEAGNVCYEPDVGAARIQMRTVVTDYEAAKHKAVAGRQVIEREFNWAKAAKGIERACVDTLEARGDRAATAPAPAGP